MDAMMIIKTLALLVSSGARKARPFLALCVMLALLSITLPRSQAQALMTAGSPISKLSLAL